MNKTVILLLCLWSVAPAQGQASGVSSPFGTDPSARPQQGGSATRGEFAPVLDSEKRPITAGGFVKNGPIIFKDIAEKAGLTTWRHTMGTPEKNYILETTGSGVALLDYDNDGWLDIYLVNGSSFDALSGKTEPPHAALFHNNHDGTFTDVAEAAGVALGNWSTGATFGDYDGDGRLDLFVPGYIHWDMDHLPPTPSSAPNAISFCQFRGASVMCGPRGLKGESDHLFHNNGDGTFTDVSKPAGVADEGHSRYGFTSVFVDVDNDGKVDLLVANDSTPNYLYLNKGDGTFKDVSIPSGFALNQDGQEVANMGMAIGDYRNNGLLDLYTGTFSDDYKPLFRDEGKARFTEIATQMGIADVTYPFLTWSTEFIDYDNDGWKDIFSVNGHVFPQVDHHNWGTSWAQRPLLFHNLNGEKFELMPAVEGTGLALVIPGRGAAFGDLFNNGKIDVVINCIDHVPALLQNVNPDKHHWVGLKLVGGPKSPRDAVGAAVYLTAGGVRHREDVLSGGSYESSNDQRVHFGLGDSTAVDKLEIHWPSGLVESVALSGVDRFFVVEEGKGLVPGVYDSVAPSFGK